jgi:hypothetical protein
MKLKTIKFKGKDYVEVSERLKAFRELYKGFSLTSNIVDLSDDRVVIRASVKDNNGFEIASGIAYEILSTKGVNQTSFIENCETSAWGRALGNLGIGIDGGICSADELENALSAVVPVEILEAIEKATTENELKEIWTSNVKLQQIPTFQRAVTLRKKEVING